MPNLAALMERALDRPLIEFIRRVGARAASLASASVQGVYLVGGQVRDLLLERQVYDLDLMVVGDARALAETLARDGDGQVKAATSFGTVKLLLPGLSADIAMARKEAYSAPGALPAVQPGDGREDLSRRDFTVNAMAIDIWPDRMGTLFDLFGGMRDITMKRLRVLHEKSFEDDPTRILRGLRYEARLEFQFEARTAEYLSRDSHYLDRVSGARIRSELERILGEPERGVALANAEERGVLAAINPALRLPKRVTDAMGEEPVKWDAGRPDALKLLHFVALMGAALTADEARAVVARLEPPKEWIEVILAGPRLRELARLLDGPDLKPSEVVEILAPFPTEAIRAQLALAPATPQRDRFAAYLDGLNEVRPECNGDDLMEAGIPEGPVLGELLAELKRARLDGLVKSKDEELAFARRRLPILQARGSGTTRPAGNRPPPPPPQEA